VLKPALLVSTALLLAAAPAPHGQFVESAPAFDADDVLAKARAAYAALTSYADSGTVLDEAGGFTDRSTFRTLFIRNPRYLLIEYRAVASEYKSGHRLPLDSHIVLWMENGELQTWVSKTQAHETYPADGGQQVNALSSTSYGTAGISVLIPSHLYGKSGLASAVHATEEATADGLETINGRRCFRILGVERWRYPSGRETGVRPITIWVDAETYLIHKIVQDTPKGMPRGAISRRITTLKHQANPKLDPAQFRFTVPTS
jgi:outer membrane lipoprotein-sorting protein